MKLYPLMITLGLSLLGLTGKSHADELTIYVIKPKTRINWSSPSKLSITSGLDSSGNDYAPIGHFAVEVKCSLSNHLGINHILTGMERVDKVESRKITLEQKLGLGSLIYTFNGALESATESNEEINEARKAGRLMTLNVPTSSDRCQGMLDFVQNWISHGSYQNYGGNKDTASGEGAGCADFAMELFRIATEMDPPSEWKVSLAIPNSLIGDGKGKEVSFTKLLTRTDWAQEDEPSTPFSIYDTNQVQDWISQRVKAGTTEYMFKAHLGDILVAPGTDVDAVYENLASKLPRFRQAEVFKYHFQTHINPNTIWNEIRL